MGNHVKRHSLARLAVLALLCLPASLGWAETADPGAQIDCRRYRQGEVTTLAIGIFQTPEIRGGTMEPRQLIVRPEYLFQPWSNLSIADGVDHTALFEVEIESGLPPTEPQRSQSFERTHFVLLLKGLAYGKPGYSLTAFANAPIGEPLTVPEFERIGKGPAGFAEIRVEGQADRVTAEDQLFAEIGPDGEPTAVLSCKRPGAVPNPTCSLVEQVGLFSARATFRRAELPRLDLIRDQIAGFAACLTED